MTIVFRSYFRSGLAAIGEVDVASATAPLKLRVGVDVGGERFTRDARLLGPESVQALSASEVLRTNPKSGAADFEPNMFPSIEFRSPDLPWLLTPEAPAAERLSPWLVLIVVENRAGVSLAKASATSSGSSSRRSSTSARSSLAVLTIADGADRELPPLEEAWAWAHTQEDAAGGGAFSRLVCPRRLEEDTLYIACVVPAYASGVAAGLGASATFSRDRAWASPLSVGAPVVLPVYYSWEFRTAAGADFEALAKLLDAAPVSKRVGVHALELADATLGVPSSSSIDWLGAIVSPAASPKALPIATKKKVEDALAQLVNAATPVETSTASGAPYNSLTDDPVVTLPLYGGAQTSARAVPLEGTRPLWLREVNVDPKHRSVAGLGAEIVRQHQEELMGEAWDQVQGIERVNRRIERGRLASEVGATLKQRVDSLDESARLLFTRPAHARVPSVVNTVFSRLKDTEVPSGLASTAFRRATRHGGPAARALGVKLLDKPLATMVARTFITMPAALSGFAVQKLPAGAALAESFSLTASGVEVTVERADVDISTAIENIWSDVGVTMTALAVKGAKTKVIAKEKSAKSAASASTSTSAKSATSSQAMSGFASTVVSMRSLASAKGTKATQATGGGGFAFTISREEQAFDADVSSSLIWGAPQGGVSTGGGSTTTAPAPVPPATVSSLLAELSLAMDAKSAIARSLTSLIRVAGDDAPPSSIPSKYRASPVLSQPLAEWLARYSLSALMPGFDDVPTNSVSLLATNPAFISAFLLGANHELAREFLWREYPADLRGTWLKQFWWKGTSGSDRSDIADIRSFNPNKMLAGQGDPSLGPSLVLLIRGEVIRKYPDLTVYAVQAEADATDADAARHVMVGGTTAPPLFAARVGDDGLFVGFALKKEVAQGGVDDAGTNWGDGYFFVLEEHPTALQFGLDVGAQRERGTMPTTWENVSFEHLLATADAAPVSHVSIAARLADGVPRPLFGGSARSDAWGSDAASMARITCQRPVRVLIHASSMLQVTVATETPHA